MKIAAAGVRALAIGTQALVASAAMTRCFNFNFPCAIRPHPRSGARTNPESSCSAHERAAARSKLIATGSRPVLCCGVVGAYNKAALTWLNSCVFD